MEAKLKKRVSWNAKLSYWVSSSSEFSVAIRHATFVVFWLCKFVFGSHPYYAVKPLYFRLAIKISAGVSLPLAPMFLGHLYVQLDILRSNESQAGSCHIVTSSVHSTIEREPGRLLRSNETFYPKGRTRNTQIPWTLSNDKDGRTRLP